MAADFTFDLFFGFPYNLWGKEVIGFQKMLSAAPQSCMVWFCRQVTVVGVCRKISTLQPWRAFLSVELPSLLSCIPGGGSQYSI